MNLRLDPPPVPPLDPARRAQLRKQVMDKSRPAGHPPARRWIAPAIGVGAVAAVVAGSLVITNRPPTAPDGAGPATAATPTAPRTGLEVVPDAEAAAAFAKACERGGHTRLDRPLTIIWARRVPGANPRNTDVLMILKGSGASGLATCLAPSGAGGWEKYPSPRWVTLPTQNEGLAGLTSGSSSLSAPKPASRMWKLYRARPEVARVESRLVWKGTTSPWQQGYVDSGYAYADNRVNVAVSLSTVRQEVRAYDAQGRLLPIEPK
ncbi:hypothetical protein [Kribbella kalugense]|uniref:Uncharacterized protein n=1 Tax=Kribbella kalugense TaxID=2512221 RepID=A0A4R7ZYB9_9ACTN|nr:hypothetical protein [Kribbella kalugense]TDW22181.1 hypothetical protein EV650_1016 [Kribbella kalugense]